ncbi:MAG: helix-turn-helix transcriptional regulator, partial [Mesorhizobium sp.]
MFVHFDYSPLRHAESRLMPLLNMNVLSVDSNDLVPGLIKQILRVANNQPPYWKKRITVLLDAILEELCATSDSASREKEHPLPIQIAEAIAYMEEHLAEPLTIEAIARKSGWSHEHFTRMFVASIGISPKRALLERRLLR